MCPMSAPLINMAVYIPFESLMRLLLSNLQTHETNIASHTASHTVMV